MNKVKKFFFVLFLSLILFNIYSIDYYVCLGSFTDSNNALELSINLSKIGIETIHEKVKINNKNFTRVLFNKKISNLNDAINEVEKLKNNKIIKNEKIFDLWIRPGKLINFKKIDKKMLDAAIAEKEKIEKEKIAVKKEEEIKKNEIVEENKEIKEKKEDVPESIPLAEKESEDEKENISESIPIVKKESEEKKTDITIESKYRKISSEGYGNFIFANEQIEVGKEDNYQLKSVFKKPEKIFARCYFPGNIGEIKAQDFWHEIWIDGKFIRKTVFYSKPDPNWDQMQIWISEEVYSDLIYTLEKGEYKIIIWVLKNEITKVKDITETKTIKLSKGEFTYIVP